MSGRDLVLFGTPRVERDGAALHFERHKTLALLAYLAVTGQAHARDVLAALFWPEVGPREARANLRRALSQLRQLLGPGILDAEEDRVALPRGAIEVDVGRFRACLAQVAAHHHPAPHLCDDCLANLSLAADLYRDDFLAGFSLRDAPDFDAWQTFQTESLRLELAGALEQLALAHGERGDFAHAVAFARRWLALDPLCEPAYRCLMRLHAAAGDRAAAFAQYEACRTVLESELGIPPEAATTALYEELKTGVQQVSSGRTAGALQPINNLPAAPGACIGREAELGDVAARLADPACRLLTIIGPGGIGKTRLALEAARDLAGQYRHGVCFVDLAPVPRAELLSAAILNALGVAQQTAGGLDQQLCEHLRNRQLLLVLDNYEHLLTGAEPERRDGYGLVTRLAEAAPEVKLLATSRARLNVRAEWLLPLEGLALPREAWAAGTSPGMRPDAVLAALNQHAATALFLACVHRLRPDFAADAGAGRAIARICRLIDGTPLAIEMAAAWTRVLSLEEIAERLAQGLDLLTTTLRDVPPRQRSMAATFDYSWRLLNARERSLLRQLSVFQGGFTGAAAEAVAGATPADLASLADTSWLPSPVAGRYTLHELVRQYCAGKLEREHIAESGETGNEVQKRHAAYYENLLHELAKQWFQGRKPTIEIAADFGNVIAAWDRMVKQDEVLIAWGLCHGLGFLGDRLGRNAEVALLFDASKPGLAATPAADCITERGRARAVLLALLLASQSERLHYLARYADASACLAEARVWLERVEARDARWAEAHWFYSRGQVYAAYDRGDAPAMVALGQASLDELREGAFCPYSGDISHWLPEAHMLVGWGAALLGEYEEARHMAQLACKLAEAAGSDFILGFQHYLLSWALLYLGEFGLAAQSAQRMSMLAAAQGDALMRVLALGIHGAVELARAHYPQARVIWRRSLAAAREAGMQYEVALSLIGLGDIELARGHPAAARRLYKASGAPPGTPAALSVMIGLGRVALWYKNPHQAREHFRQALRACQYRAATKAEAIAYTAEALLQESEQAQAAELCAFVLQWSGTPAVVRDVAGKLLRDAEAQLSADESAAARERGRNRDLDDVLAEIAEGASQRTAPLEIVTT